MIDLLRTVQAAAKVINTVGGYYGSYNYRKLLEILYLIDRRSLIETGSTITNDCMVNTKYGPALGTIHWTLSIEPKVWTDHFHMEDGDVCNIKSPGDSELSDFDVELIHSVSSWYHSEYIVDLCKCPEWEDPGTGAIPLSHLQIWRAAGLDDETIQAFQERAQAIASLDAMTRKYT